MSLLRASFAALLVSSFAVAQTQLQSGAANPFSSTAKAALASAGGVTTSNLGSQSISTFCDPADLNSAGMSTTLSGAFGSGTGSGLHLDVTQGPSGEFGYVRVGTAASDPGIAISNGHMCLSIVAGNIFGRYTVPGVQNSIGQFNAAGVLVNLAGTSSTGTGYDVPSTVPISGDPTIVAGATWHFQVVHREPGGQWNFSNGLTVTF
ncbi:MAG: hypothetical protein R3F17_17195 [Planctomycetota bacterium]